jgi:hypothetical protein
MQLIKSTNTILKAISQNKDFRNDFNAVASTISDKIYSYFMNPNCTCRNSIVDWINNNVAATNALVNKYIDSLNTIEANELKEAKVAKSAPTNKTTAAPVNDASAMLDHPTMWAGTVHTIERNPEIYKELIKRSIAEKWLYRGINVVPDVVDGKPVWSIFFF